MEVVSLAPQSLQLSFPTLSSSLTAESGCCLSQLRNAADIEVRIVTDSPGGNQVATGHLSPAYGAILTLPVPAGATISSLTMELSEPGNGAVVAIGATTAKSFLTGISTGDLEIALICPDLLKYAGFLSCSWMRTMATVELETTPRSRTRKNNYPKLTEAKLLPAGLLASGELACVPRSVLLLHHEDDNNTNYNALVSRSALSGPGIITSELDNNIKNGGTPVVLELCPGDSESCGGICDLNQLATKAVHALADSENAVVALATKDVHMAIVLMAIAPPDTHAIIWTGERKEVAKRLRMPASIHPDFHSGVFVEKKKKDGDIDGQVLLVPANLLVARAGEEEEEEEENNNNNNDNRLKRKKSSVRWASPLSTRCTIENTEIDGTA